LALKLSCTTQDRQIIKFYWSVIIGNILFALRHGIISDRLSDKLKQGTSIVASPTFCTIEAKRDEAFSAGEGEALGQMLALHQKCGSVHRLK